MKKEFKKKNHEKIKQEKEEKNKIYVSENKNISFIKKHHLQGKNYARERFLLNYKNKNYKVKNNLRKYDEKE